MKQFLLLVAGILLFAGSEHAFAQTGIETKKAVMDTLITRKGDKIVGKITKISETEIEYKKVYEPDAPVYSVSRDKIREIRFGNGTRELVHMDEMTANPESEILDQRSAIKFHFFSPIENQIAVSYEHCLKVGTNAEVTLGWINNSIINNNSPVLIQGGYFAGGVKFLLGQDFYMNGMKYAHPLKGRYLKPEVDFSSFIVRGVQVYVPGSYPYYNGQQVVTDQKINSLALMINYGRQFVLGNMFTFGYSIGMGYAFTSSKYADPTIPASSSNGIFGGNYSSNYSLGDMYSHYTLGGILPLAYKGTITLGYIFK